MFAHFGFVIAFAERDFFVAFAPPGELVVVESDAEAGFVRNSNRAIFEADAAAFDDFIFFGLPRVMSVAGEGEVGTRGGDMRHGQHANA